MFYEHLMDSMTDFACVHVLCSAGALAQNIYRTQKCVQHQHVQNLYIRTHQMCSSSEHMEGVLQVFKICYIWTHQTCSACVLVQNTSNVFCMCSSLEHMKGVLQVFKICYIWTHQKRSGRVQFMRRMCSVNFAVYSHDSKYNRENKRWKNTL